MSLQLEFIYILFYVIQLLILFMCLIYEDIFPSISWFEVLSVHLITKKKNIITLRKCVGGHWKVYGYTGHRTLDVNTVWLYNRVLEYIFALYFVRLAVKKFLEALCFVQSELFINLKNLVKASTANMKLSYTQTIDHIK